MLRFGRDSVIAFALVLLTVSAAGAAKKSRGDVPLTRQQIAEDVGMGQDTMKTYETRHTLITSGRYYAMAKPIFARLTPVASAGYGRSFHFYVHRSEEEDGPNAYAVFGPNILVETKLLDYARDREQVSGVVCHEIAHALHHDSYRDANRPENQLLRSRIVAHLRAKLHGKLKSEVVAATNFIDNLRSLRHSRQEEERADLAGSDVCARAAVNPWGLVWMLRRFGKDPEFKVKGPAWFRDHPNFKTRIAALKAHFKHNRALFAAWKDDEGHATPLSSSLAASR